MHALELKIVPLLQVVIIITLMLLTDALVPFFGFNNPFFLMTGMVLWIVAFTVAIVALWQFKRHQTTVHPQKLADAQTVVSSGLYAYSRNPMYLAMLIAVLGFAIWLENIVNIVWVLCFFAYITRFQIVPEERILAEKFGTPYQEYKANVRRWL